MTEIIPQTSDVQVLVGVVGANPTDATAQAVLADAMTEDGGAYEFNLKVARAVAEAGSIEAAVKLIVARQLVDGYQTKSGRSDTRSARRRGALCRMTGATGRGNRPISTTQFKVIPGDAAPSYEGESYHFETPSGRIIHHPNAYKRIAKSAVIVYCPASHVVTVGAEWLIAHADALASDAR